MTPKSRNNKNKSKNKTANKVVALQKEVQRIAKVAKEKRKSDKRKARLAAAGRHSTFQKAMAITPCAKAYAAAVVDPWAMEAEGACVPIDVPGPSYKGKSFMTIDVTLGTAGVGFIAVAPTVVNDKNAVTYSGSTYAGTTIDCNTATTGVNAAKFTTLPATYANVVTSNIAQGRVVVAGIRIKYTGSPLYETGSMYILGDSNRQILHGFGSSDISAQTIARVKGVSRKNHTLTQTNNNAVEREYSDELRYSTPLQVYPYGGTNGTVDTVIPATMGILIKGATTSAGQTFQVDLMLRNEYTGVMVAPMATPSHTDTDGYSHVRDALDMMSTVKKSSSASDAKIFNSLMRKAKSGMKKVAPYLMDFSKAAMNAYLPASVTLGMQALDLLDG